MFKNTRRITLAHKASLVAVFCVVVSVVGATATSAQSPINGLGVSPLRSELNVAPGTSLDGSLTVTNATAAPMTVNFSAEEFSVINQQYDYAFTQESQVAKWVNFTPNTVNLAVGEVKTVSYRLSAPLSAEPSGRYISLFASTNTGSARQGVDSVQRVASLLYITVLGDVTRSGHLVSLTTPWLVGGTGRWSMALQNTGTTHFRSRYSVDIWDIFGHSVGKSAAGDVLILPGTVRLIVDQLPLPQWPGVYKYSYNIGLGDTPASSVNKYIIFIPRSAVLASSLLALAMALALIYFRQKRSN